MPLVTTVKPTYLPVTLEEAKIQCRILSSDSTHDIRLIAAIQEATASVETFTGARFATQTVRLELDCFPAGYYSRIDLGVYPVSAVTSIAYDDIDNVEQTLVAGTDYWSQLGGMYPFVQAVTYWPATMFAKPNSVRITMTAGSDECAVDQDIRHAILMRVKEYFDNAGESVTGQSVESTVNTVKALTDMHRRIVV